VRLLARIPDTDTARRVTQRADALLHYEKPTPASGIGARLKRAVLGAPTGALTATPPTEFDSTWETDGVMGKVPDGTGERAHWLTQALGVVPPEHWEARFGAPATELVRAALASEWKHAILHGWSRAAMVHHSGAWATALWDAWREMELDDSTTKYESMIRREMVTLMLPHLAPSDREVRVLAMMALPVAQLPFEPMVLINAVPVPWSTEYGRRVLRQLAPHVEAAAASPHWGGWTDALAAVAARLPAATLADALALERRTAAVDTPSPANRRQLEQFRQILQLRQRIHAEIPT
jgi:hypothetical protein